MNKLKYLFICISILLTNAVPFAKAQTTISNTPSTDVVEVGKIYAEVNFGAHFANYSASGFQAYGIKTIYGLRRNLEIGSTALFTKNNGSNPSELVPNIKWKAYESEKYKVAVSGGAVVYVPLNKHTGSRPVAMIYANASKKFNFANGFRITGGFYGVTGAKSDSGNKKGVLLGYEQSIYKGVTFVADWAGGKNRFGYSSAGLSVPVTKRDLILASYNFGNSGRGNNWFGVLYGHTF